MPRRCPSPDPPPPCRRVFTLIFLICVGLLGFALYLQHWEKLDPCPWCVVQRLGFMLVGLIALVGALHGPAARGARAYAALGFVAAAAGAAAAAYHVWLQSDPVRARSASARRSSASSTSSTIGKLLPGLLQYDGPCTLKPWSFLGLSIPEWSLAWFLILAVAFVATARIRR